MRRMMVQTMPYKTLPDEASARATIEATLRTISPGVLPPGVHKQVALGGLFVEFHSHKTRTSWLVSPSGDVLRIGRVFARGRWETALGIQMIQYCSDTSDPLPHEMMNEVRDVVDGRRPATMALGHLQQAMDALGESVECVQERSEGVPDMIDFVFGWSDPRFLVAMAVVLRFAGARSSDVQLIYGYCRSEGRERVGHTLRNPMHR